MNEIDNQGSAATTLENSTLAQLREESVLKDGWEPLPMKNGVPDIEAAIEQAVIEVSQPDDQPTAPAASATPQAGTNDPVASPAATPVDGHGGGLLERIRRVRKETQETIQQRESAPAQAPVKIEMPPLFVTPIGDAAKVVAAGSVDYLITDPPLSRSSRFFYPDLSRFAMHALKPGGLLACIGGDMYLPDVLTGLLSGGLTYLNDMCYHCSARPMELRMLRLTQFKKIVLVFSKGARESGSKWIASDTVQAPPDRNDKRYHPHGQSVGGMSSFVKLLTEPGSVVCDPFCGGGSIGVAALKLGRRFVGMDIDPNCIDVTRQRIAEMLGVAE